MVFREIGWNYSGGMDVGVLRPLLLKYGLKYGVCLFDILPPINVCLDSECSHFNCQLVEPLHHDTVVFTRDYGPIPAYTMSFYCRGCYTRYYPNYFIHDNATQCTYYGEVPKFIQASKKIFVEATLFPYQEGVQGGKAMFQLKSHLEKMKLLQLQDSMPVIDTQNNISVLPEMASAGPDEGGMLSSTEAEDQEAEIKVQCDQKLDGTTQKHKARFGRQWTHNKELCVASCGMILGQATFYGAEGLNGIRLFWKKLFPTQRSLLNVMWYDNNCGMQAMLQVNKDTYSDCCALPVDVFHFKSKHKEQDTFCGMYCNSYIWQDLVTEDGKWLFNSSADKQTNAWFGGFLAMIRDMRVERYNLLEQVCMPYKISQTKLL
ncbi:hypothetical protein M422DRAFT_253925 [Sphaerobolus stellatus SS14]|uniref:CxC5 like cysteine cluster associated with KDZ domain-containing protein n=1 Tax=Sphaerobolus stellatus (strain SS14) TaxID=990650 RepID=A0A0C9VM09_SPHS4|nr:hypothetical protein M422DRAFT_253925 [Sphaerobolus stellatus SS14]